MKGQFSSYVYVSDAEGEEHEIIIEVEYNAIYAPAKLDGPWENCHPDESEMEITEVTAMHDLPPGITAQMVADAAENDIDRLVEKAWEDYHD